MKTTYVISAERTRPVTRGKKIKKFTMRATDAQNPRNSRETKMRPKLKIERYYDVAAFEDGVNDSFRNGYTLHSWNDSGYRIGFDIIAVFVSIEASVELTLKIIEESTKQAGKS